MLPFIGENYDENSKILLLGESHYFPKDSTIHKNANEWYKKSSVDLSKQEGNQINTRKVVNNMNDDFTKQLEWSKSRTIFRNIEDSLITSGFPKTNNSLCHVAFMHAFLRPAEETGQSIRVS
ncbi:MAG: hypothetical protein EXR80_01760 [Methylococcales bacterium]|nr:hypothetical protein [Methylococcales bacterium]